MKASTSNCFRVSNQPIRTLRISEQSLPSNVATSEMQTYQESAQRSIDVLLVEDDTNEQALLRGILEMEGYRVHTANNGHEALDCLKRVTPRFVLLDMMMPECDGRETFQRIRRMPALENLPIFAVSGASPDSLGLPVGKDGVEDWFPKPLNAPQLVEKMRQCVQDLSECV